MNRNLPRLALIVLGVVLVGCAQANRPKVYRPGPDTVRPIARPGEDRVVALEEARTAEDFDSTSADERAAAIAPAPVAKKLGTTIATLGNPALPGFWLQTPLVSENTPGRVVYPATGTSVSVDLIPTGGPETGGSRISLAAMRLLGAPLTGLPELIVYAN
jgi:hypothetical protein